MVWRNARILQYPCRRTNVSSSLCWHGSRVRLSISSYVGWTFHCDPAGNEWRTAHCNSNSVRSPNIHILPPYLELGINEMIWQWNTLCLREANLPCQHLTSRNKPHVTWLEPRVLSIFLPIIFLISLFCYLSSCPWRSSEITLCDGLLQVFLFYRCTLFGF